MHVKFIIINFLKGDVPAWPVAMNFIVATLSCRLWKVRAHGKFTQT